MRVQMKLNFLRIVTVPYRKIRISITLWQIISAALDI